MNNKKITCNICSAPVEKLFEGEVLQKYTVSYYGCAACEFIQTERPYSLQEVYENPITNADIGLIGRNLHMSIWVRRIICKYFDKKAKYLDYAGGYGMLVRMMRDKGLNFYRYDQYCENLFAKFFDIDDLSQNKQQFELLTAFEVFEHLPNPIQEIEKMFSFSDNILFSTNIIPQPIPRSVKDWWYFAPAEGQHICFYSVKTLQQIARRFGKQLYTNGTTLHLLTSKKLKSNPFGKYMFLWERFLQKAERIGTTHTLRNQTLLLHDATYVEEQIAAINSKKIT